MIGICPVCEKETNLTLINHAENISVRGDDIPVEVNYFKCSECNSEFDDPNSNYDALDAAYREYRVRRSMVQPETIKQFREQYGFTQIEFANLLGLGGATLSRYENGALQDEAHDTLIMLAMQPGNLLEMIEDKPNILSDAKQKKILNLLHEMTDRQERSIISVYETRFSTYAPGKLSGFLPLNISKLLNAMIYFCAETEIPKTKLNKLLFYADFKHFKEYLISITGAKYAHLPYGPVPDKYEHYLAALLDEEKAIIKNERQINEMITGEYLLASKKPDLNIYSPSELKILAFVKEYFQDFNANKISSFSHGEKGYQDTHEGEIISYEYAEFLKI
ncbi:MAG: type II TA system antitoxin MqsA family protein [Chloroflexota bacterium]